MNVTAFLSPAGSGPFIWGVGPSVQLATGTDEATSTRKWAAGPSFVGLTIQGPWVIGALVQQIWSFAGNSDRRDLNQALLQYFINYNLPNGWYVTSSPIITANWEAGSGDKWTVPVGGGFGKVFVSASCPSMGTSPRTRTSFGRILGRTGRYGCRSLCCRNRCFSDRRCLHASSRGKGDVVHRARKCSGNETSRLPTTLSIGHMQGGDKHA